MRNNISRTVGVAVIVLLAGCGAATAPTTPRSAAGPSQSPTTAPTTSPSPDPTPSPTSDGLLPDGTWQVELTEDELVAAGWAADVTPPGTYRWTFADERATLKLLADVGDDAHCEADMALLDDNVELTYDEGMCGGEVDVIAWELADDGLHLTLISTNAPLDQQKAYLETEPWQPVD